MRPKFSPDGRWIAHALREGGGWSLYLMTFPVTERKWHLTGATPRIGSTQVHFDDFPTPLTALNDIAITRDGQRFLVSDAGGADDSQPVRLIQGWPRIAERASGRP